MLLKITALSSMLAVSMGQIVNGKCGDASITFSGLQGRIQCNYQDNAQPKHAQYENGVLKLTAFTDDLPHSKDANGPHPRTEVTFRDSYGFTQADIAEFETYFYVPTGIFPPFSLFQIKCGEGVKAGSGTTSIMLNFKDGNFQRYDSSSAKPYLTQINGQWIRFKVVFRGPQHKIDVYFGDQLENKFTYPQNGEAKTYHFKFGPYGKEDRNQKHNKMETWFKHAKMTKNGKNFSAVFTE